MERGKEEGVAGKKGGKWGEKEEMPATVLKRPPQLRGNREEGKWGGKEVNWEDTDNLLPAGSIL
jgi:hypothetical protein